MIKGTKISRSFYGMTTLGEKGQAVIPVEARKKMKLEKGEKLLVLSFDDNILVFSKIKGLENFADHLTEELKNVKDIIKKNNK